MVVEEVKESIWLLKRTTTTAIIVLAIIMVVSMDSSRVNWELAPEEMRQSWQPGTGSFDIVLVTIQAISIA
jgi:hypothetical protein